MPKPFMTYEQQLTKLKDEKHILIPDEAKAKAKLQEIGYYSLVTGYKHIFRVPGQKIYKNGTSFDEIVSLYEFDEAIRALFLRYLLHIEQHLRSLLSYYFTEKYGESQSAYSNAANYNNIAKHQRGIGRLISELKNLSQSKNYPYIEYQRNTYNNVPLWVLVNAMTFGSLSKMYIFLTSDLQTKVSKNFPNVNEKQLRQYLSVLTKFRNVCAHNERLFSYRTKDSIPDTDLHRKLCIPKMGSTYALGKCDLFAVVIAFRYLLSPDEFRIFKRTLASHIDKLLNKTDHITETELLDTIGFPLNWKKISAYKL